ncbi:MAG: glycine cleavage system H-protein subunit [Trizodia sp. TS-e1964]|nr:MAG: glycine cleavage system H-protein subunit [Trizodia sp. TS-e1964]
MASSMRSLRPQASKLLFQSAPPPALRTPSRVRTKPPPCNICKTLTPRPSLRPFSASASTREKKYTEDHEWIELSADGSTGTIGISAYAARSLGDVVFVELPELAKDVCAGDSVGAVESVKSASDILAPVAGRIVAVNTVLEERPGQLNLSPEGDAWIARMEVKGGEGGEARRLMTASEYEAFTEG